MAAERCSSGRLCRALWPAALLSLAGWAAAADTPMSAIDWLSDTIAHPAPFHAPDPRPLSDMVVSEGLRDGEINVRLLDAPNDQGAGLFPAERVGLPAAFWGATPAAELAARIRGLRTDTLPAAQAAILRILLAEFDPPAAAAAGDDTAMLLARIDALIAFGAVEQAMQLIETGVRITPELWSRWFDVALLLGEEARPCAALGRGGGIAPPDAARIFCLMQGGDWAAAMLTLHAAERLGALDPDEARLLRRFLDDDEAEVAVSTAPIVVTTPLHWRMLEAVGEPVYTQALPLAFAHADLRGTAGWRAQLDAAERLTRAGVLEPNRLLGLYTEARAAASGGVWDRVRAVAALEAALERNDAARIGEALLVLWPLAQAGQLEVAFAKLFAERLADVPLSGAALRVAFEIAALAPDTAALSRLPTPGAARARFIAALAAGTVPLPLPDALPLASAIAAGLAPEAALPAELARRVEDGHYGDSVLVALDRLADAAAGDLRATSESLAALRKLGLDPVARSAGLELMLLARGN